MGQCYDSSVGPVVGLASGGPGLVMQWPSLRGLCQWPLGTGGWLWTAQWCSDTVTEPHLLPQTVRSTHRAITICNPILLALQLLWCGLWLEPDRSYVTLRLAKQILNASSFPLSENMDIVIAPASPLLQTWWGWRRYRSGAGGSWMTTPGSGSETCPPAGETAWPSVPSYTDTGLTS